ncbi:MAG: hypothetical protein ACYTGZ_02325 [Planctomycetota bacterium]|jgi:hypothetical protein
MKHRRNLFPSGAALRRRLVLLAVFAMVGLTVSACTSSGAGLPPLKVEIFNFSPNFAGVRLNAPLELTFSAPVDPDSVNPDSIRIFTTTTTQDEPDPGAPAIGVFLTSGNVVRFLPRIPQKPDLSDAGLRIGFRYAVQVPAAPTVIAPVTTTEGDPMEVSFSEEFTTLNQTILPAPGDITAEPNLPQLHNFFIDEGIENGTDPCPRGDLDLEDRDSPQVVFTDPAEGESGFGTITGIQPGLGTAFVRMDPLTLIFSEPISTWRIRADDIVIRNQNLGGEDFDLALFFQQDRTEAKLLITVFDSESAFDKASVPQGRYVLTLTNFTDLAGNDLVNSNSCEADGTFQLSFSTVSSPTLPTDIELTFTDVDGDGHVDVGGLETGTNNPNEFPLFGSPFLGGMAIDTVAVPSTSGQTSTANWGSIAYFTGREMLFDNGFKLTAPDMDRPIPVALRLRGAAPAASTAIMAPLAGRAIGTSDQINGSTAGSVSVVGGPDDGKQDFEHQSPTPIQLFTGDAVTGPILYHYRKFTLLFDDDLATNPNELPTVLSYQSGSLFPLLIFAEDSITIIKATIDVSGRDGQFGFNGNNDASGEASDGALIGRNPGGRGGEGGPGGGAGGDGGAADLGPTIDFLFGDNGAVPANVLGSMDDLSEAAAGLAGMATGGGGLSDPLAGPDPNTGDEPVWQGGGGGGQGDAGSDGADACADPAAPCGHGVGGKAIGQNGDFNFTDPDALASGGAGGGGGGAEDDDGFNGIGGPEQADVTDDGGGGGGGGAGFVGLYCAGDITLGRVRELDPNADPPDFLVRDDYEFATIRAVGGRGGSTYSTVAGSEPIPGTDPNADPDSAVAIETAIGEGEGGGGGAGGGICIIAGGTLTIDAAEMYVYGKDGGNSPFDWEEGGENAGRGTVNQAGNGGAGVIHISDQDGFGQGELPEELGGGNAGFLVLNDPNRIVAIDPTIMPPDVQPPDLDPTNPDDLPARRDFFQMSGVPSISLGVWGDEPRERMFEKSQIVTEFFDTLSDFTSYDGVRVLSNIPRFEYEADPIDNPDPDLRTIRVFLDVTKAAAGLPDMSPEDPATGNFDQNANGFTREIGLYFNSDGDDINPGDPTAMPPVLPFPYGPQHESFFIIPAGGTELGKRFVRVRIVYDLATIGTPDQLLSSFAPPGAGNLPIADDLDPTNGPDNTLGNTDTAPEGVPAVAEIRVTFTVGG